LSTVDSNIYDYYTNFIYDGKHTVYSVRDREHLWIGKINVSDPNNISIQTKEIPSLDYGRNIAITKDGVLIITHGSGYICTYDFDSGTILDSIKLSTNGSLYGLDVTPDGKTAYAVERSEGIFSVDISDVNNISEIARYDPSSDFTYREIYAYNNNYIFYGIRNLTDPKIAQILSYKIKDGHIVKFVDVAGWSDNSYEPPIFDVKNGLGAAFEPREDDLVMFRIT
jgi:hypothetical protein